MTKMTIWKVVKKDHKEDEVNDYYNDIDST